MSRDPRRIGRRLSRLMPKLFSSTSRPQARRKSLLVEALEDRRLMAADTGLDDLLDSTPGSLNTTSSAPAEGEHVAGSTAQRDLVAFARALSTAGVKFYGAAWCPACTAQKELFEDGGDFLPFLEVTNPDRSLNALGTSQNIQAFPTWEFQDGSRLEGVQSLETLSQRSGIAIPTSANPFIAPIADTTVRGGSPLHVALNGYDPNGGKLTYTVSSSNPNLVSASVLQGNKSARISVAGFGDMVFQLFNTQVPRAAGRFIELANAGFYDAANNNPDMRFYRVSPDFVIQFGDPTGTGSGGSTLGNFDDQFHVGLQHNVKGILSWAKAGDDTNDSQLFITDTAARFLDGNHSVIGQIVEGEKNRDAINSTALVPNTERPSIPVTLNSVDVVDDMENGMLRLSAAEGASGVAEITVTVTDEQGHTFQDVFMVTVAPDTANMGPFLSDIPPVRTTVNTPAVFQLQSNDAEGDPVVFDAVKQGTVNYTFNVSQTGQVTVTPPNNFIGTMQILVRVRAQNGSNTTDTFDSQLVPIVVAPATPTGLDLLASSDSGFRNDDNRTNQTNLTFQVNGVSNGALVRLHRGNSILGQATANGTTATIQADFQALGGDGQYTVFATQILDSVESNPTSSLTIVIDTQPPGNFSSQPPTQAFVGLQYLYNAQHPDEGSDGFRYALRNAPTGAAIDPDSGQVTWTPTAAQVGNQQFLVVAQDAAGNERTQPLNLNVSNDAQVAVRLALTTPAGVPVTSLNVGDSFVLQAFVEDLNFGAQGVFAAYMDVVYDNALVSVNGPIQFGSSYPNVTSGNTSTAGLIDEVGAAAGFTPLGEGEFLLFSVPMKANASGRATFNSDPPDNLPSNEILIFGQSQPVPLNEIQFGATELFIDISFGGVDDKFNVDEDSQNNSLNVLANDTVLNGVSRDSLFISQVGTATNGTVSISTDTKRVLYTPNANFFGLDQFTYTVSDGNGTDTATVVVEVQPINDPPTAVADTFTVNEDTTANFLDPTANDLSAPDGPETFRITGVSATSAGGTVTIGPGASHLLYTPRPNFNGPDSFTYTISDGNGGTATGNITVNVTEANDPPVARNDVFTILEDAAESELNVLANDDTAGETGETLSILSVTTPSRGGTARIENGKLLYRPAANVFGSETFRYTISDGNGGQAEATVTVSLTPQNDPPTATDDSLTAIKDGGAQTLDVLANDSVAPDIEETLTITAVTQGNAGGTVAIVNNGKAVSFSPAAGFTGQDTFTYTISDGNGGTDQATVAVQVLNFIPSTLSGFVYLDVNNNGVKDAVERPVGGVTITLAGTSTVQTTPIQLTTQTAADGSYKFTNLPPGSYRITETHPIFLLDGQDTVGSAGGQVAANDALTLQLAQNTQATNYNFGERGRAPQFMSTFDYLASSVRDTVLAASHPQNGSQWYVLKESIPGVETAAVAYDSATHVGLMIDKVNESPAKTSLALNNPNRVRQLGSINPANALLLLRGPSSQFQFQVTTNNSSSSSTNNASSAATNQSNNTGSSAGGEGEAVARLATSSLLVSPTPLAMPLDAALDSPSQDAATESGVGLRTRVADGLSEAAAVDDLMQAMAEHGVTVLDLLNDDLDTANEQLFSDAVDAIMAALQDDIAADE